MDQVFIIHSDTMQIYLLFKWFNFIFHGKSQVAGEKFRNDKMCSQKLIKFEKNDWCL